MQVYTIEWSEMDIRELRPHWTHAQCSKFLMRNAKYIKEHCVQKGFEIIEDLMSYEDSQHG